MTTTTSCGILLYRIHHFPEFFIVHPGGIYNKNAPWGIPKGKKEHDENHLETAIREFSEETGTDIEFNKNRFINLGYIKQNSKKNTYCFAYKYDLGDDFVVKSNLATIEYPRNSGIMIEVPEIDEGKYCNFEKCKQIMVSSQFVFVERLDQILQNRI